DELFDVLVGLGQHPKEKADTVTVLEKVGHFLDEEVEARFRDFKEQGHENHEISDLIAQNLDVEKVLTKASEAWDGGYVMGGIIGTGDAFIARDPNGIRPCFWYEDDEVVVAASERPVIQTAFNATKSQVHELEPGEALIIGQDGATKIKQVRPAAERTPCSFERIYFSRGNDADIYQERMALGESLVPKVLEAIEHDIDSTVFSFIPNTAETSFYGLVKGIESHLNQSKIERIIGLGKSPDPTEIKAILEERPRVDKVALKDAKLRTFIADDGARDDLVAHAYDITYGTVERHKDQLVVIDDSIVRGTTLKRSILRILDRLDPKRIVVVSSAPQIRYPDCYGIDMAKMG
ncbi:MAG TPA: amidophosphoribosyltransferase, partial [Flavobacteriales bacterium]|nr:amidophosphoribosyltransferase [Flavobacteriales bacterium]